MVLTSYSHQFITSFLNYHDNFCVIQMLYPFFTFDTFRF
jgi:hypothetical protein